jgi:hyperosmotically inducible protein
MIPRVTYVLAASVLVLGLAACGENPQEQFEDAVASLEARQSALEEARARAEHRQEAVEKARAELEKAREAVSRAEARVQEARERVRATANDEVLFRAVQTRLLEELDDVAVDADVEGGVVTLTGTVPSKKVRDRAVEIARGVPGVVGVESRLTVPEAPGQGV